MKQYSFLQKAVLFILFFIVNSSILAQEKTVESLPFRKSKHQIGLNFGGTTGIGFSYKYVPGKFSHQITLLPVFVELLLLDFSYSISYKIKETKYIDYNLFLGNHTLIFSTSEDGMGLNATGTGAGINFKTGRFCGNLNLGVAYVMLAESERMSLFLPTAEVGIFYKLFSSSKSK